MPRYFKESEINSLFDVSCKESFAICKIYLFCYHFSYSKKSWPTRIYAVALTKKKRSRVQSLYYLPLVALAEAVGGILLGRTRARHGNGTLARARNIFPG